MPEFTRYKKRISHRFSHRLSHGEKNPVTLLDAGSLTAVPFRRPDALRRLTASPGYVIPAACLQLLLSSTTLIFFFLPLHFLLLASSLFFLFFFCISLSAHFSFPFLLCVSLCVHIASLPERNSINCCQLYFRAYTCLYILFFLLLRCICLAAYFFYFWIPLRTHSFFYAYPCVYF